MIVSFALFGAVLALAWGLLTPRHYMSSATFVPQASEAESVSSLAAAASQLGIGLPATGNAWGPPVYAELLESSPLLTAIAADTFVVAEDQGQRRALTDLLKIDGPTPALRLDRAVHALQKDVLAVSTDKNTNSTKVTVTTRWPSVSLALAQELLKAVAQFNLETRRSQAKAEREFVETQVKDAEHNLRTAEDTLQGFLELNRSVTGSPRLEFARDRLQREVGMRQTVYTTLMQSLQQARIREIRDTPVITMLEAPQLPIAAVSRYLAVKILLGGFTGTVIATLLAFLAMIASSARRLPSEDAHEFFGLLESTAPWLPRTK